MSFDGVMLNHVIRELSETIKGSRITKIYQLGTYDLLFQVRGTKARAFLMSTSPNYTRLHLTDSVYEKPPHPPGFCMFLRKHLEGAFIDNIIQNNNDRVVTFTLSMTNELGDRIQKNLVYEALGKDANIIITTQEGIILDAFKRTGPFEEHRTIVPSAKYHYPSDQRTNPYDDLQRCKTLSETPLESVKDYLDAFSGVSPLFIREFLHRYQESKESKDAIFSTMLNESYYHMLHNKKSYFHAIKLTHLDGQEHRFTSPQELFDAYFHERDKAERRHQKAKDLTQFVDRQIERLKAKLEHLSKDYTKTNDLDTLKEYAQQILTHQHAISKTDRTLECLSFDGQKSLSISLDPTKSPIKNSNDYFRKYRKLKLSIPHIKKQQGIALDDLEFFKLLKTQLAHADLIDIEEIREELINEKYLPRKSKPGKKAKAPLFITYQDALGVPILVGKNNIQNAYITHKIASANDVWFHIQNSPGSHVLVRGQQPLEELTIRTAASLAAFYSPARKSSSVPIDYTDAKWIKKIPGKRPCFVRYQNHKTIYIDPDESFISTLKRKP